MNIRYIRNPNASHMIIDGENQMLNWEHCMMQYNTIDGILFAECVCENGITSLWYNITGKQALDVVLESAKLNYELLYRIINGIFHAAEKLVQFLLQTDALFLSPESIFFDRSTGEVWFCYYPGNEQLLTDAFSILTEYLLTRVDRKDEDAVTLVYSLYEQTREDNFSFYQLQKEMKTPYPKEEIIYDSIQSKELGDRDLERCSATERETVEENLLTRESTATFLNKELILSKIKQFFRFPDKKTFMQNSQLTFLCGIKEKIYLKKSKRNDLLTEEFVFEPEKESVPAAHPTVLLSDLSKKQSGILKYEGKNGHKDMVISTVPFLIGSDSSCEGYLPSAAVSRKHAKITRQEDIYFIEDLNSSNGTYVAGELINCRVRMSLHRGDVIIFADEKFIFS